MCLVALAMLAGGVAPLAGQSGSQSAPPVLGAQIGQAQAVPLPGNVRKDLTPQIDLGQTEDSRPMRLSLVLKRSPEQQADLDALLAAQQQPGSPMYHQWLTPEQFGERFGAAQADVAKLTAWLSAQGFKVNGVLKNGSIIDFSGTAGQVRSTFQTAIHYWQLHGGQYAANAQEPSIPGDIASIVAGIHGLSQVPKRPHHSATQQAAYDAQTHTWSVVSPNGNVPARPAFNAGSSNYFVTPQDFYTIYHVNPIFTGGNLGAGGTVAVVEQSDMAYGTVNSSTGAATGGDINTFRSLFGVSGTLNMKVMHGAGSVSCSDPGVLNGDEGEATLDAEWANALAPSAQLIYMACSPYTDNGVVSSLAALIDNNIGNVLSMSYGSSETTAVASDYSLQDTLFQQAAAQGQTVIVSAGDSGSDTNDQNTSGTATSGLNIDIFSASPLVLSAGGTDFSDYYDSIEGGPAQTAYWSASNTSHYGDALGYIPETPWNDSCASSIIAKAVGNYTGAAYCGLGPNSDPYITGDVVAGGGGFSTHYAQPSWQTGVLGVSGTKRAVPDVSLFAANGVWGHALVFCDSSSSSSACTSTSTFGLAGGTSFVAPQLAGITGLLNTATNERQGVLNPALYALARTQFTAPATASACYSNGQTGNTSVTTSLPAAGCIFHDVTTSNNDVPCQSGSLNCYVNPGKSYGMLSTTGASSLTVGYPSTAGYDEATGLGSIDVYNLITKWNQAFTSSTALVAASATVTPSTTDKLTATVTGGLPTGSGSGAPAVQGNVNFAAGSTALGSCSLSGNSCSLTINGSQLASGSNSITATYAGNGTFPPSTSSAVTVTNNAGTAPANPMFSSGAGTYVTSVQVTLTDSTPGALIYYLINGGTPVKYTTPITISTSETLAAIGVLVQSGGSYTTSSLVSQAYTIIQPPAVPVISPLGNHFKSVQPVTITDGTTGASIFYSINGGTYVPYTTSFNLSASESISAYASITSGGVTASSAVNTQNYLVVLPPANPVFSLPGATYTGAQSLMITDPTPGSLVFYSINGGAFTQVTGPISVTANSTIKAVGYLTDGPDYQTSALVTMTYIIN
jgi:subtilase family serine protease